MLASTASEAQTLPSLGLFAQSLRDYQEDVLFDALEFQAECENDEHELRRRLYASPTGSGKGSIELAILRDLRNQGFDAWILTPSLEVLRGFIERCGNPDIDDCSAAKLHELGERIFVSTPTSFRNAIRAGKRPAPDVVVYDEVHHAISDNEVSNTLFCVAPFACWLGFTATPYRGNPKGTAQLREDWGEVVLVLTVPEAIEAGYQALPTFRIVPLVDDDTVKTDRGEFQLKAVVKAVTERIGSLADLVAGYEKGGAFDHPTAVTVPSSEVAWQLQRALKELGVASWWINCDTKPQERAEAYGSCKAKLCALISIRVLNEGVDFPWLRRLIDARPTLSPVSWLQQLGRIMRPGPIRPEYVCTNRNLERHAYLLQGAVPRSKILEAQELFEKPSKRLGSRAIGLEKLTKFRVIPLPLKGGLMGAMYALYHVGVDAHTIEYCVLLDPAGDEPIISARKHGIDERTGERSYGRWQRCGMLDDFEGFATSTRRNSLTKKQREIWQRLAGRHGLNPEAVDELKGRQVGALFALMDTKRTMTGRDTR